MTASTTRGPRSGGPQPVESTEPTTAGAATGTVTLTADVTSTTPLDPTLTDAAALTDAALSDPTLTGPVASGTTTSGDGGDTTEGGPIPSN